MSLVRGLSSYFFMPNKRKFVVLPREEFFSSVAAKANYVSGESVKDIYYGLLRVIIQELRERGAVNLPDFGDIVIHRHKARMSHDLQTDSMVMLPEKSTIKFRPCKELKKYFHIVGAKNKDL